MNERLRADFKLGMAPEKSDSLDADSLKPLVQQLLMRIPEFGDQRYKPESGYALVFSSSLLHEAMHVTAGRRFVLLAFLFGD